MGHEECVAEIHGRTNLEAKLFCMTATKRVAMHLQPPPAGAAFRRHEQSDGNDHQLNEEVITRRPLLPHTLPARAPAGSVRVTAGKETKRVG